MIVLALAVVLAIGTVALGLPALWVRRAEASRLRTVGDVPAADVALVLGAGVRFNGFPTPILQGRLDVARRLYSAGKVQRILVSGSPESRGHSEPVSMRNYLLSHAVPDECIIVDETGRDTWLSCRAAVDMGLREVTVVTSDFHLPRAVLLCLRAGLDAYGVGHDSRAAGLPRATARGSRREVLATAKAFWWRR
ncbi:SanA/YdcF family protein [Allosaccharopolyspora coralli]|uniref:SanA/YdcF family protein n=1 Tax=Allosaccharopolyspora coralli TaxID=2665642 RepID=UPI001E302566|nr:YdcF family protein [Allosaccharopolyspora coralli]